MKWSRLLIVACLGLVMLGCLAPTVQAAAPLVRVLIVDGQNNHDMEWSTPFMKRQLEASGRFRVAVTSTPPKGAPADAWDTWRPDFAPFDVVLLNYNGQMWPEPVKTAFEQFVERGGGVVVVHAGNNPFQGWQAFDQMIGLGWRKADYGDRIVLDESGKQKRVPRGEGPGAGHGVQHEYVVTIRDSDHPITRGLPPKFLHTKDELYHGQRGPAQNMHVLASAWSDPATKGTGEHEPMVWLIPYGRGQVFTILLGHARKDQYQAMQCVGFVTLLQRGTEWVGSRAVTIAAPAIFPTADRTSTVPAD